MKIRTGLGVFMALAALALVSGAASASHQPTQALHNADCDKPTNTDEYKAQYCADQTVPEADGSKKGAANAVPGAPKSEAKDDILDRVGAFFVAVGKGIGDGASAVGTGVALAGASIGVLWAAMFRPLVELLALGQPSWMGTTLYASAVSGGTAAAVGGAQAGGYYGWKRFLPLGLGLPLFSRIQKDELLENDRRARIYELIKTNPGIHLSEIARELDFAWGTTLHHLRKLRADRLIMFKEAGHHKSFFINGSGLSEIQMEALSLVKNGTLANLAHFLEEHPRTSLKELSEALNISPPLAAFHIRKLEKAGLVTKVREGKSVRLTTTSTLPSGFFRQIAAQTPQLPEPVAAAS